MKNGLGELGRLDSCYIGEKIQNLKLKTIDGEIINLGDFHGKVIILNLWSTSCGPCLAEIPGLYDLTTIYKGKDIVFISLLRESIKSYKDYLEGGHDIKFIVIPNSKKIYYSQLNFIGFPRSIVIDKKGVIRYLFLGGENSRKAPELIKEKLIPVIDELLLEKDQVIK